jgi:hypothetical protein
MIQMAVVVVEKADDIEEKQEEVKVEKVAEEELVGAVIK